MLEPNNETRYRLNPWRAFRHDLIREAYEAISPFFMIAIRLKPDNPDQAFEDAVRLAHDAGTLNNEFLSRDFLRGTPKEMLFTNTPHILRRRCAPTSDAIN